MTSAEPTLPGADACLVLMLKAPARSKGRLAAQMGHAAHEAAEKLWACAYEDALAWRGAVCFAPASEEDGAWLAGRVRPESLVIVQTAGNLGERINFVNASLAARGIAKQIFIGTDCPEIDPAYLSEAAASLQTHDAVLGPARDGGVVLMGAGRPWPALRDLPWSAATLRERLESRLDEGGWSRATLATLTDVDSREDLPAVAAALRHDTRPARRALGRWLRRRGAALATRR
jgi:hypothetical protein